MHTYLHTHTHTRAEEKGWIVCLYCMHSKLSYLHVLLCIHLFLLHISIYLYRIHLFLLHMSIQLSPSFYMYSSIPPLHVTIVVYSSIPPLHVSTIIYSSIPPHIYLFLCVFVYSSSTHLCTCSYLHPFMCIHLYLHYMSLLLYIHLLFLHISIYLPPH